MSFRIKRHEPVWRAVRRVVAGELRDARKDAADDARPLEARVHAVRVHLKRARSALRLVRGPGSRGVRRADRALREAGRSLAPARDAAIVRATLRELGAEPPATHEASDEASREGSHEASHDESRAAADLADLSKALAKLEGVRVRRAVAAGTGPAARRAFVRGYRAARRCLGDLRPDQAVERFHAWRKLVKRLALQARLFDRVAPALSRDLQAPLDRLAERLGDLHDLALTEAKLAGPPAPSPLGDDTPAALMTRLRDRSTTQRAETLALGAAVLAPKPRDIRKRLDKEWRRTRT